MKYGPADGMFVLFTLTISLFNGSLSDVAWKNGMVIFAMNVPSGLVRLTISLLPLATAPLTLVAPPSLTFLAPTMLVPFGSVMNGAPGEARALFAVRSIARLKLAAVTLAPSLNLKPGRMKNVYFRPLFETVNLEATSGTSLLPAGPCLSG